MGSLREFIPRSDNPTLWRQDESGRYVMPELQSEFLDWLLTPKSERELASANAWAKAHNVNSGTLTQWKKDRRFRREWEDRAASKNISVDRVQGVLDTLHEAAMQGDVQAAKLYLSHVERLAPPQVVQRDPDVQDLSDEDLRELVVRLAADV